MAKKGQQQIKYSAEFKIGGFKNASKKGKYPTYRKKKSRIHKNSRLSGGDKRDQTADLLNAMHPRI